MEKWARGKKGRRKSKQTFVRQRKGVAEVGPPENNSSMRGSGASKNLHSVRQATPGYQ